MRYLAFVDPRRRTEISLARCVAIVLLAGFSTAVDWLEARDRSSGGSEKENETDWEARLTRTIQSYVELKQTLNSLRAVRQETVKKIEADTQARLRRRAKSTQDGPLHEKLKNCTAQIEATELAKLELLQSIETIVQSQLGSVSAAELPRAIETAIRYRREYGVHLPEIRAPFQYALVDAAATLAVEAPGYPERYLGVLTELADPGHPNLSDNPEVVDTLLGRVSFAEFPERERLLGLILSLLEKNPVYNPSTARMNQAIYDAALVTVGNTPGKTLVPVLEKLAPALWEDPEKNALGRVLVGTWLSQLAGRRVEGERVYQLVDSLFEEEMRWVEAATRKWRPYSSLGVAFYRRYLGTHVEYPSIYPLLLSVEKLFEASLLDGGSKDLPREIASRVLRLLELTEPPLRARARGKKTFTRRRIWYLTFDLLRKWTGLEHLVWSDEWRSVLSGDFDFRDVLRRKAEQGATQVRDGGEGVSFFGIKVRASRVVFLLDSSQSMIREEPPIDYLTPLKREVVSFVSGLYPGAHYNLVPFNTHCSIDASASGRQAMVVKSRHAGKISPRTVTWLKNLRASGKTVMDEAFAVVLRGTRGDWRVPVDEVFLITDGQPTDREGNWIGGPRFAAMRAMVQGIARMNQIQVHTIGFPGSEPQFLRQLASSTGGKTLTVDPSRYARQGGG